MLMLFIFIKWFSRRAAGDAGGRVQFQIEHGGNEPRNRQMSFVAQTDLTLTLCMYV